MLTPTEAYLDMFPPDDSQVTQPSPEVKEKVLKLLKDGMKIHEGRNLPPMPPEREDWEVWED